MAKNKKIPNYMKEHSSTKEVRQDPNIPTSFDSFEISWKFHLLDDEGMWGWGNISADDILEIIKKELKDKEHLNWVSLGKSGSHNVKINDLKKEAQQRLDEIGQKDLDNLYSLRLSGEKRIWGIRDRYALKILWWDPQHQVCPSHKKHT